MNIRSRLSIETCGKNWKGLWRADFCKLGIKEERSVFSANNVYSATVADEVFMSGFDPRDATTIMLEMAGCVAAEITG
jgi:hypothetical protein